MPQTIIGSVVVSPLSVRVGESVLVDVRSPAGASYDNKESDVVITINGVRGSKKYLQFQAPGPRRVRVVASRPGQAIEHQTVDVTVLAAAGPAVLDNRRSSRRVANLNLFASDTLARPPLLSASPDAERSGVLRFRLPEVVTAQRSRTMKSQREAITARARLAAHQPVNPPRGAPPAQPSRAALAASETPARRLAGLVSQMSTYHWDFGDGTTLVTASADATHDFGESIPIDREYGHFHVRVAQRRSGQTVQSSTRTVTVLNPYFVLKQRGSIQPRVVQSEGVSAVGDRWLASFTIKNREAQTLRITSRQIQFLTDQDDDEQVPQASEAAQIVVPANGTARVEVSVPRRSLPPHATGFAAHYTGAAADNTPVRCSAYFDVPLRSNRWKLVQNPAEVAALNELVRSGATSSARTITAEELTQLVDDQRASAASFPSVVALMAHRMRADKSFAPFLHALRPFLPNSNLSPAEMRDVVAHLTARPKEGDECDPDHLPDNAPEGFSCQLTPEKRWATVQGRFVNARKGDVILSQGGPGGLIGGLLRQVHPPQRYSHSGIMTRNYDQVTHSTGCPDWLLAHPVGSMLGIDAPFDGLDPKALKYIWPGVITQTVENTVEGEEILDPEGKPRVIKGFSALPDEGDFNGVWELVPPLVVKPEPKYESTQVRATLKRVADYAAAQKGKSHYRFYCYTDPTIGLTSKAPDDAGWAAGTYPSVCSSFVWMCLKQSNVKLEGPNPNTRPADLEAKDSSPAVGAEVNAATRDGLYLYRADERRVAAEWMNDTLQHEVWSTVESMLEDMPYGLGDAAGLVDLFTGISTEVANQMVNTFASDWSDTAAKDSDRWRTTGDANAVSPDNILNWDSPANNGVYGWAEELRYEPPQYREVTIWKWKKVQKHGDLSGKVSYQNAPIANATVELYDGMTTNTDAAGRFTFHGVPVGDYELKASVWHQGFRMSATAPVNVHEGQNQRDLALQMPPELNRRVRIEATLYSVDDEAWPWSDEKHTAKLAKQVMLGPWHTHEEVVFVDKMGGEIRSELHVVLDLDASLAVNVKFTALLYEGTTEETNDLDAQAGNHFTVQKDRWGGWTGMKIVNGEVLSDDSLSVDFTVWNERY